MTDTTGGSIILGREIMQALHIATSAARP